MGCGMAAVALDFLSGGYKRTARTADLTGIKSPQPHPLKILCKNIIVNQRVIKVQ
jgi:hypothetical protein